MTRIERDELKEELEKMQNFSDNFERYAEEDRLHDIEVEKR